MLVRPYCLVSERPSVLALGGVHVPVWWHCDVCTLLRVDALRIQPVSLKFLSVMRDVAAGEYRIPSDAMRRVLAGIRSAPRAAGGPTLDGITEREQEMLALFARGRSYAEIGDARGGPAHNGA